MIRLEQLSKNYAHQQGQRVVLRQVDWQFAPNKIIALTGRSGAGKSTLLNILGGLDRQFSGEVYVGQQALSQLDAKALAKYRRQQVGFVFQDFHLLDRLSILDNVMLSARFMPLKEQRKLHQRAALCLENVGLKGRDDDKPAQLSGGERQRVALARALLHKPKLILADEPTGNLDQQTAAGILDFLKTLTGDNELTVIMATHDAQAMQRANQIIHLRDGKLRHEDKA